MSADLIKVRVVGPAGADVPGALKTLSGPETTRLAYSVVRLGAVRIKARAFAQLTQSGVGRALWGDRPQTESASPFMRGVLQVLGGKKSSPSSIIRAQVTKRAFDGFTMTFSVNGIPALVEAGGKTRAHVIRAKVSHYQNLSAQYRGKQRGVKFQALASHFQDKGRTLLAFTGRDGKMHFAPEVNHPGSAIAKQPFLGPAIDAEAARISTDLQRALDGYIERVTSKGAAA